MEKARAADFLKRFEVWHNDNSRLSSRSKQYRCKHGEFQREAAAFGIKGHGMVLSQEWCDALAKKFGLQKIYL